MNCFSRKQRVPLACCCWQPPSRPTKIRKLVRLVLHLHFITFCTQLWHRFRLSVICSLTPWWYVKAKLTQKKQPDLFKNCCWNKMLQVLNQKSCQAWSTYCKSQWDLLRSQFLLATKWFGFYFNIFFCQASWEVFSADLSFVPRVLEANAKPQCEGRAPQ